MHNWRHLWLMLLTVAALWGTACSDDDDDNGGPVNQPPLAENDAAEAQPGETILISVLDNDLDPEADPITLVGVDDPVQGTTRFDDTQVTFTAPVEFTGIVEFDYTVADSNSNSSIATVFVTVDDTILGPTNDTFDVFADQSAVLDVLANDTGEDLTIVSFSDPQDEHGHTRGTLELNSDETLTYTPPAGYTGQLDFTYTVSDGTSLATGVRTAEAGATIRIRNSGPTAGADIVNGVLPSQTVTVDVLSNDSDTSGQTLSLLSVDATSRAGGLLTINGSSVSYTAPADLPLQDFLHYTIANESGATAEGEVAILSADVSKLVGPHGYLQAGWSVANVGDLDDDGYDELAIGVPGDDVGGSNAGLVYLFYGRISGFAASSADARLLGDRDWAMAGHAIAAAGDVNADGYDDFLIGGPQWREESSGGGVAYLVYGSSSRLSGSVSLDTLGAIFVGEADDDKAGHSVAGAGDINGDGFDDVLIGARHAGTEQSGTAYLIYGMGDDASTGTPGLWGELSVGMADVIITGTSGDELGSAVTGIDDFNGDGVDDFAIGARLADVREWNEGVVYVFHGTALSGTLAAANADVILTGQSRNDEAGWSLTSGDLNGDGLGDLVIGSRRANGIGDSSTPEDPGGIDKGAVYVLYGAGDYPAVFDLNDSYTSGRGLILAGQYNGDSFGYSVAADDLDGDGIDDLVVGVPHYALESRGAAYVFNGSAAGIDPGLPVSDGMMTAGDAFRVFVGERAAIRSGDLVVQPGDGTGHAVAIHEGLLVVTAPAYAADEEHQGAVYLVPVP